MDWLEDCWLGYLSRQTLLDQVAQNLAEEGSNCNDFATQCRVYDEVGLDSDTLTDSEVEYLEREIARRM